MTLFDSLDFEFNRPLSNKPVRSIFKSSAPVADMPEVKLRVVEANVPDKIIEALADNDITAFVNYNGLDTIARFDSDRVNTVDVYKSVDGIDSKDVNVSENVHVDTSDGSALGIEITVKIDDVATGPSSLEDREIDQHFFRSIDKQVQEILDNNDNPFVTKYRNHSTDHFSVTVHTHTNTIVEMTECLDVHKELARILVGEADPMDVETVLVAR